MGISYFIVSKPLQYFNAINIDDDSSKKTCLIVDNFFEAETFYQRIKNNNFWYRVVFFANSFDAYKWLEINTICGDNLFIDSDYGVRKTIWLSRIKSNNIYVYEEGIGSYRDDLLTSGPGTRLFKLLLKILGVKEHMGGGAFTKAIILYDIDSHEKLVTSFRNARLPFRVSFEKHLLSDLVNKSFSNRETKLIAESLNGKKILIYLTDFEYNVKVDLLLDQYYGYIKILKPHPNNKNIINNIQYDIILDSSILIELFIFKIAAIAADLIVVHENSSVAHYLREVNEISFIDLNK